MRPPVVRPQLLTTAEAAARLGVAPETLRRWVAERLLDGRAYTRTPGNRLRFRPFVLDELFGLSERRAS